MSQGVGKWSNRTIEVSGSETPSLVEVDHVIRINLVLQSGGPGRCRKSVTLYRGWGGWIDSEHSAWCLLKAYIPPGITATQSGSQRIRNFIAGLLEYGLRSFCVPVGISNISYWGRQAQIGADVDRNHFEATFIRIE